MHIAFEDDRAMAVLVTEPMNPGQLFLVPKAHVTTLDEMGEENTAHLFEITRRLVQAIRKAGIRCEGTEVHLSEQPTSLLPHLVVQLLPRFEGDSLWTEARISRHRSSWDFEARRLLWWEELAARRLDGAWTLRREVSDEELREIATRVREAYQSLWGRDASAGLLSAG